MRILFLHSIAIAPGKGGIERCVAAMTSEFEARGIACFYLAAKPVWKECADAARQAFLPNAKQFDSRENTIFFDAFLCAKKIDIVLFSWADGKRIPKAFADACRSRSVPVVAVIHTDPNFYFHRYCGSGIFARLKSYLRFRRQTKIYRWNAGKCVATVLLSERFRAGFLKHFSRENDAGRIVAISNPASFPRSEVDFSKKERELLFVGRMENAAKRVDLLLKIWAKLEVRFPDWSLRLVGDGNDLPANKKLAETLGLRRAFFEGFQNPENYYREASIFCMTSAYEGFGMVLVESAAFGCVPVAFDSFAAVRDIISDGENGVLVPAFDLDAYAEKLAQLMSDNALRERLAQTALSQIPEKFSAQKIGSLWEKLFEEIKANRGCGGSSVGYCSWWH